MKKIKSFLLCNVKIVTAFILGGVIFGGITAVVAYVISAGEVTYDNSQSGMQSTTVQGAIDELYIKASKWIDPNNMGTPTNYIFDGSNKPTTSSPTTPPSGKNVYLGLYEDGQYGVCIKENGTQHCFRYNNWIAELKHIQEVFSGCDVNSDYVDCCTSSGLCCSVGSNGGVGCTDFGTNENCYVNIDGSVNCLRR